MVERTRYHGLYALFIFIIIALMVMKKDVVIACLLGSFCLAFVYHKSLMSTIQPLSEGLTATAGEFLTIILIISLMVAMLKYLNALGADHKLSMSKLIKGPTAACIALALVMYVRSLFFRPTPATAWSTPTHSFCHQGRSDADTRGCRLIYIRSLMWRLS